MDMATDSKRLESDFSAILIEDDPHERLAIRRVLNPKLHSLIECESGEQALDHLEQHASDVDIIIADYKLPGMDGLSLFRKAREKNYSSPFILLTGNGSEATAVEAFKAGVDEYLIKASNSDYLAMLATLALEAIRHNRTKRRKGQLEESLQDTQARFREFKAQYHGVLTQSQKMEALGTLAGGIAHDFNNILQGIMGWAEVGTLKFKDHIPVFGYFEQILEAGKRGRDLVQQILTFSRQQERIPRPLNLTAAIEEAIQFLRATIPTNIEFRFIKHQDPIMMFADPLEIQRILINLCTNAEYALRSTGGVLSLEVDTVHMKEGDSSLPPSLKAGRYVKCIFTDTGPGIPEDLLSKVFDPFFTTKPAGEGTGMGLAVVHGIVRSLDGEILVESSPHGGTTFTIYLPESHASQSSTNISELSASIRGTGHILYVDDEGALTKMIKEFLEHVGYTVTTSHHPLNAFQIFRQNPQQFDCLITDQTMPHMSGHQLAQKFLEVRPNLPIILCTGFSHVLDREKALAQGISAVLLKPIVLNQLSRTLANLLPNATSHKP